MYINTPGTSTPDGRAIGFETEAFAISDCMNYIKPPVYTIGVGQVWLASRLKPLSARYIVQLIQYTSLLLLWRGVIASVQVLKILQY